VEKIRARKGFSTGALEQRPLLNNSALILQNPSVTVELNSTFIDEQGPQVLRAFGKGSQNMKG